MVRGIGGREKGGTPGKKYIFKRLINRRVHCVGYYCKYTLYSLNVESEKNKMEEKYTLCRICSSSFKGGLFM
jgi:hypothetical protein